MNTPFAARTLIPATLTALLTVCCHMPAHALLGGTNTTRFGAVGDIGGASGVLISSGWVLTAAHVAAGLQLNTARFVSPQGSSLIDQVVTFSAESYPNHDIALVHLVTPINGAFPILNDQLIWASQLGTLGTLTAATAQNQSPNGYGNTTGFAVLTTSTEGTVTSTVNWLITKGAVELQGGDSGGALFKGEVTDSAGAVLLGIASAALDEEKGGAMSGFVQVAAYKPWIDTTMAQSGQRAQWASTVPEPSTNAMFWVAGAVGAAGVLRHRRRAAAHSKAARPQ